MGKMLEIVYEMEKTLWKKKRLLVTSIFFFSHNVFKGLLTKNQLSLS